jgi:hypothetical protein
MQMLACCTALSLCHYNDPTLAAASLSRVAHLAALRGGDEGEIEMPWQPLGLVQFRISGIAQAPKHILAMLEPGLTQRRADQSHWIETAD